MAQDHEKRPDPPEEPDRSQEAAEGGAESYGGDPDAGPSVTPEELRRGSERDQAEG